jgi:acyl carrier protein
VVVVGRLPLTANGKVDYGALPEAGAEREGLGQEYVAPRTGTEELLANIWAEVLGMDKVGIEDDFFDLGGHSLMATRVTSRIRQAFNVEMPLRALFETPTISELAESLEEMLNSEREGMGQIADVLEMLGGLSEEEVNAMLEERTGRAESPDDSLTETPYS